MCVLSNCSDRKTVNVMGGGAKPGAPRVSRVLSPRDPVVPSAVPGTVTPRGVPGSGLLTSSSAGGSGRGRGFGRPGPAAAGVGAGPARALDMSLAAAVAAGADEGSGTNREPDHRRPSLDSGRGSDGGGGGSGVVDEGSGSVGVGSAAHVPRGSLGEDLDFDVSDTEGVGSAAQSRFASRESARAGAGSEAPPGTDSDAPGLPRRVSLAGDGGSGVGNGNGVAATDTGAGPSSQSAVSQLATPSGHASGGAGVSAQRGKPLRRRYVFVRQVCYVLRRLPTQARAALLGGVSGCRPALCGTSCALCVFPC